MCSQTAGNVTAYLLKFYNKQSIDFFIFIIRYQIFSDIELPHLNYLIQQTDANSEISRRSN